jgi:hypothetical protein
MVEADCHLSPSCWCSQFRARACETRYRDFKGIRINRAPASAERLKQTGFFGCPGCCARTESIAALASMLPVEDRLAIHDLIT